MDRLVFDSSAEARHAFYLLDKKGVRRGHGAGKYVSIEHTPRPDAMAELVERTGDDKRIRHVRDQQYFAWRFQSPLSVYRFLFWEDTRMEGYLVLRTSVYANRVGVSIVDWEATNALVQADLLHAAIHLANCENLTIWSATLPDDAKTVLQKSGFNFLEETRSIGRAYRAGAYSPTVLMRPVRDEMLKADWLLADRRLLELGNWDLRMIYSDSY